MKQEGSRRDNKNAGVTTIIVVCVMAMITALSLSLFLTAEVMLKNSANVLASEQSRILAESFSREIRTELTGSSKSYQGRGEEDAARVTDGSHMSLWHYIRWEMFDGSWPYYDEHADESHHKENAVRTFQMTRETTAGEVADTVLKLYWLKEEAGNRKLIVETEITVKGQSCKVVDQYTVSNAGNGSYENVVFQYAGRK